MARKKCKGTELAVFKGREARLNRAIFQNLSLKGQQTVYDIHKNLRALKVFKRLHYGNVNKRVRALEQSGYVKAVSKQTTKAGFVSTTYELESKAYLAMLLQSVSLEQILNRIEDTSALEISAIIAGLL